MTHPTLHSLPATRIENGRETQSAEILAEETPIALLYNGLAHAVMMATPADLEDFALGFSLSEGIVEHSGEVRIVDRVQTADGISIEMAIPQSRFEALEQRSRSLTGRTGCGLCGTAMLAAAIRPVRRVTTTTHPDPAILFAAFAQLQARQPLNDATGAMHAAAVLAFDGELLVREDVGRHNAIDKVIGATIRAGHVPQALLVTSRASYEVVHKAAQAGCGLVAAISAPTALAVRIAEQAGIRLIGFARDPRMTVYTNL